MGFEDGDGEGEWEGDGEGEVMSTGTSGRFVRALPARRGAGLGCVHGEKTNPGGRARGEGGEISRRFAARVWRIVSVVSSQF